MSATRAAASRLAALALGLGLALVSPRAGAQTIRGPEETRPDLPSFPAPSDQPPLALPPVELAPGTPRERLSSGLRVFVSGWRVRGSTVFGDAEFARALAPWTGREISSEDLVAARDAVTRLYVDHGYVSSGAVLPDQDVNEGVIELQVVEGKLGEITVRGTKLLRRSWVATRARRGAAVPLDVKALEESLALLQQDPRIRRLDARLEPGPERDLSVLDVSVEEAFPLRFSLRGANDLSTAIGGEQIETTLADIDLTGNADTLWVRYAQGQHQGLREWSASYDVPVSPWDTRVGFVWEDSRSKVVSEPFEDLDVKSDRVSYALTLSQPLWETLRSRFDVGLTGEIQHSRLRILGEDFDFFGLDDGSRVKETVLRPYVEWTERSRDQVVALRMSGNFGVDWFDPTVIHEGDAPDGLFTFWLAQAQLARRLPDAVRGSQLIARVDVQLAQDALLPLEQLSIGGLGTVRGVHVNQIVADSGAIASLELRVPVTRDVEGRDRLQIAPFVDWGKGWNHDETFGMHWIASVGLGLRYALADRASFAVYWGAPLRHVEKQSGGGLQNSGVSVEMNVVAF
jgi:hemolysin activation/secretion protein